METRGKSKGRKEAGVRATLTAIGFGGAAAHRTETERVWARGVSSQDL